MHAERGCRLSCRGGSRSCRGAAGLSPAAFLALSVTLCAAWLVLRPAEVERKADEYMTALQISTNFSGSVLVSRGDDIVFAKGYGYADIDAGLRNDTQTQYRIGSITKSFVAITVLALQGEGALSVDDSVCEYIAPCPDHWRPITIHHLLSHTSGLASYTDGADYLTLTAAPVTAEEILERFRDEPLRFAPGEKYEYSNSGYFLLGRIIEKVTGESVQAALSKRVFTPAGMIDSGDSRDTPSPARLAMGYRPDLDGNLRPEAPHNVDWSPGGVLYTTAEDMRRWSRGLDTDAILPKAARQAMWTPVREDYGYGWQMPEPSAETLHRAVRMHSGRTPGYTACFAKFPDDDLTAVVLSNDVMADTCPIVRDLAAIALGEPYTIPIARRAIRLDTETLDRYVGEYRGGDLAVLISRDADRLILRAPPSTDEFQLFPESETDFFFKTMDAQVTFSVDRHGRATGLTARAQNRVVTASRIGGYR